MAARLGQVIYWAASGITLLAFGLVGYIIFIEGVGPNNWGFIGLLTAIGIVVWLVGRTILYVLARG
jgi:hypothetical protein